MEKHTLEGEVSALSMLCNAGAPHLAHCIVAWPKHEHEGDAVVGGNTNKGEIANALVNLLVLWGVVVYNGATRSWTVKKELLRNDNRNT